MKSLLIGESPRPLYGLSFQFASSRCLKNERVKAFGILGLGVLWSILASRHCAEVANDGSMFLPGFCYDVKANELEAEACKLATVVISCDAYFCQWACPVGVEAQSFDLDDCVLFFMCCAFHFLKT